jgi:type I restriction-modification system DNA methylase subunit
MNNKIKKIYKMTKDQIDDYMKLLIPIKKLEKDKYAEVFTSPLLINKMLDLFPNNVWSNSKLKWLDPSVGAGFFMICVYLRLMKGLNNWEHDEQKRSKHIIENMLFMVEINKKNCDLCNSLFGNKVRLICGDFLDTLNFNGPEQENILFDCIVGNPPFQNDFGLSDQGKRINGGKSKLYERIFLKSFSLLKNGGFLSFVVPDNIFAGNGTLSYQTIVKNHVPYIIFNP